MHTCVKVASVAYYLSSEATARSHAAGRKLADIQKAADEGDADRAVQLGGASFKGLLSLAEITKKVVALKRDLGIASKLNATKLPGGNIDDTATERAEAILDRVEKALGIEPDLADVRKKTAASRYYTGDEDGGNSSPGRWFNRTIQNHPIVDHGMILKASDFRLLGDGIDPRTNKPLVSKKSIRDDSKRNAGYDFQLSVPKSVSVLHALYEMTGERTDDGRLKSKVIEEILESANERMLALQFERELVVSRRGKGGHIIEPVDNVPIGIFNHTSSRDGDPQLHVHNVILNACVRADGTTGTIDNHRIMVNQKSNGTSFDADLANRLRSGLGVEISRKPVKNGYTFEIAGVHESVIELFSKRRMAIEAALEEKGAENYSAAQAQVAALETRKNKGEDTPREELLARWGRELQAAGFHAEDITHAVQVAAQNSMNARLSVGITDLDAEYAKLRGDAVRKAIDQIEANQATFDDNDIWKTTAEAMFGVGGIDDVQREINRAIDDGRIINLGERDGKTFYSTPDMVATEKAMLKSALERMDEREFVRPVVAEAYIKSKPTMTSEQADAVRHACNADGCVIVEGAAGTGKSFTLGTVADALRSSGIEVWATSVSHKAKAVIAADTGTDDEHAMAVFGLLKNLDEGKIKLTSKSAIIVDEAGMASLKDLHRILQHAQDAGAKVILSGDTRQLKPVGPGAALCGLSKILGSERINAIIRQKDSPDAEWMIAASTHFSVGDNNLGMKLYDQHGRVHVERGKDAALNQIADIWTKHIEDNPYASPQSRLVVTRARVDVNAINERLRDAYRDVGKLAGEDFVIKAWPCGSKRGKEPVDMKIAAGDRIIFGQSGSGRQASPQAFGNNADMATIISVSDDKESGDPFVRLVFDKGGETVLRWSEFAPPRFKDQDENEPVYPVVQHAYAVTVHASQGTTVKSTNTDAPKAGLAIMYDSLGHGKEMSYVGMTRHTIDCHVVVEASRIEANLAEKKYREAMSFHVNELGAGDGPHADADGKFADNKKEPLTDEEIKKVYFEKIIMRAEEKNNPSDFRDGQEDLAKWIYKTDTKVPDIDTPFDRDEGIHKSDKKVSWEYDELRRGKLSMNDITYREGSFTEEQKEYIKAKAGDVDIVDMLRKFDDRLADKDIVGDNVDQEPAWIAEANQHFDDRDYEAMNADYYDQYSERGNDLIKLIDDTIAERQSFVAHAVDLPRELQDLKVLDEIEFIDEAFIETDEAEAAIEPQASNEPDSTIESEDLPKMINPETEVNDPETEKPPSMSM